MKIILREHVEHLGERGDEVNVAAGYARNYLLPKGLAYAAGAGSAKQIEDQRRAWATRESKHENAAKALGATISALQLSVKRRAGDGGTLYGSVTNSDVAELLAEAGQRIERRKIQVKEPIKALGEYEIPVKLHRSVMATLKLSVLNQAGLTLAQVEADRALHEPAPKESSEDTADSEDSNEESNEDAVEASEASEKED